MGMSFFDVTQKDMGKTDYDENTTKWQLSPGCIASSKWFHMNMATLLFIQQFLQASNKAHIKAMHYYPFCEEKPLVTGGFPPPHFPKKDQ